MFIKKLYRYNKPVFFLFSGYIILFALLNFKWGVVATPVLQYGMYSAPFYVQDTQTVYIIEANGKMLNAAKISTAERDILQVFPDVYQKQKQINTAAYFTMRKYIKYTGLSGFMQPGKFNNAIPDSVFIHWYKAKVEGIIREPVHSLKIYRQYFVWQVDALKPVGATIKLIDSGA